jgi:hypothetical protein
MLIRRTRWHHTGSLKWTSLGHRIEIKWWRSNKRERTHCGVRFPVITGEVRPDCDLRWWSGGLLRQKVGGRWSYWWGESRGSIVDVNCIQRRRWRAAGDDAATVSFGHVPIHQSPVGERRCAVLGKCARDNGRGRRGEGTRGWSIASEFGDRRWQRLRIPTRNFVGSSRFSRERRKGNGEGVPEAFIGEGLHGEGARVGTVVMDGLGSSRAGEGLWPEVRGDADMRAKHVSGRWEGQRYPFEIRPCWPVGRFGGWAESVPGGLFLFFIYFPFSFLIFCFISISFA